MQASHLLRLAFALFLGAFAIRSARAVSVPDTCYLFSYFTSETGGLRLAWSADGLSYAPLNNGAPYLVPAVGGGLMRDPSLARAPDGTFHLVWTTSWSGAVFGHASSTDLKTWSAQQAVPVWNGHPDAADVAFTWAPEITYDAANSRFLIVWASNIAGKFADAADDTYNPRLYATTTTDFATFASPRLFFDPGYDVIDGTFFQDGPTWWMCFKDETQYQVNRKYLQLASSPTLDGTYSGITPSGAGFTPPGVWVEGPTVVKVGDAWVVIYDAYTSGLYRASSSTDLVNWTDITGQISIPSGARHGTIIQVPGSVIQALLPPPPEPPVNLVATAGRTENHLSWTAAADAETYSIHRATQSGGPYALVATGVTGTTAYDAAPEGVTYYYTVRAVNATATSDASNESSAAALPAEARARLLFDENAGTLAADSTGRGWTGTLVNGAGWTAGHSGAAVDLDGANDHVALPAGLVEDLGAFTLSAWVRLDAVAQWSRIFDFGSGTSAYMFLTPRSSSGKIRFAISTSSYGSEQVINGAAALPSGVWTHVAVTLSGRVGILYVDGVEVGRNEAMSLRPLSLGRTTQNRLGRSQFNADPYLNGGIDDFRLFAGALGPAEVASLLDGLSAPKNLVATPGLGVATLTWDAVPGATSYTVLRSTTRDGPYSAIASDLSDTGCLDTGLARDVHYFYTVAAAGPSGPGPASAATGVVLSHDVFLFVYFQGNGETVYGAVSEDGRRFTALNAGATLFTPPAWPGQNLARDPSVLYAEGKFHLVWTSGWTGGVFGYAHSTDLLNWSEPLQITPFVGEQPKVVWAPELFRDPVAGDYKIVFTSTLYSELNDGDGSQDPAAPSYDQRAYVVTTSDFSTFSTARLFFDQNFSLIDSHLVYDDRETVASGDDRWLVTMVVAGGGSPSVGTQGVRWTSTTASLDSPAIAASWDDMRNHSTIVSTQEGQSLVRHAGKWLLYVDAYTAGHYSLYTSTDLAAWTNETSDLVMPVSHPRHGTVIRVPRAALGSHVSQDLVPAVSATAGDARVSLSWTAVSHATGYIIKRASSPAGPYSVVASGVAATGYVDTSAVNAATYRYIVAAANGDYLGADSLPVSATPRSGYQTWKLAHGFSESTPDTDAPDGDGIPLLLKYAVGIVPGSPATSPALVTADGDALSLHFDHLNPPPLDYVVEASSDLQSWTAIATLAAGSSTWTGPAAVSETGSGELLATTVTEPLADAWRHFLRLRVVLPP